MCRKYLEDMPKLVNVDIQKLDAFIASTIEHGGRLCCTL